MQVNLQINLQYEEVLYIEFRAFKFTMNKLSFQEGKHELKFPVPKYLRASLGAGGADDAVAPMPGVIEKVTVQPGAEVLQGDPLVTMIAMKMEVGYHFYVVINI